MVSDRIVSVGCHVSQRVRHSRTLTPPVVGETGRISKRIDHRLDASLRARGVERAAAVAEYLGYNSAVRSGCRSQVVGPAVGVRRCPPERIGAGQEVAVNVIYVRVVMAPIPLDAMEGWPAVLEVQR